MQTSTKLTNGTGDTPLFIAAQNGNMASVCVLVKELGADINKTNSGITPLMAATSGKHEDVVRWLVKEGADTQVSLPTDGFGGTEPGLTAACWSREFCGASAEQTKYLEAKTHCSSSSYNGAGVKKCTGCKQVRY
jgi:ankyrin repeat protein